MSSFGVMRLSASGIKQIQFNGQLRYNDFTEYDVTEFKTLFIKNNSTDAAAYRIIYIDVDGVKVQNVPINSSATVDLSSATTLKIYKVNDQAVALYEATLSV